MTQSSTIGKLLLSGLYLSITVSVVATVMLTVSTNKTNQTKVLLGGDEIIVTIADTPALRQKGLSGRNGLGSNEGVLFVFPKPDFYGFWMKDMHFPIDIIWFDENYEVVDVWERANPESYPQIYTSQSESRFVLEVQANFFSNHNLKIGNTFKILQ
ncbi:MAG: hypothetical protein COV32_01805 [Candidatus Yonathbacteria bacterium CG10_big_fil_rev_8_21_14_0_10_43_136]|nr:MAG: hypothetical protein COV32_01805 [Candidatus Yonathbacteria bacterium CG10_big_fil_rev_8_21_14_0_10_43_136]PJC22569.1 MAG: hypothetical protein CO060_00200 [Candidatus Yonathbacteria bacterium CG_4_9_14_0_2_um_filter_43_16]